MVLAKLIDQELVDEFRRRFTHCPCTGELHARVSTATWMKPGDIVGTTKPSGYKEVRVSNSTWKIHRVVFAMAYGPLESHIEIDHINGNPSDNRLTNLRAGMRADNRQNQRRVRAGSKSGIQGVRAKRLKTKTMWEAYFKGPGDPRSRFVGYFECPTAAYLAYVRAKRKGHTWSTL